MATRRGIKTIATKALAVDTRLRKAAAKGRVGIPGTPSLTVATADSFTNFAQKMGVGADNPLSTAGYGFNPITRIRTMLEWIHRGSWLGGVAVDLVAKDMTKAGVSLLGTVSPKGIEKIHETATTLAIWTKLKETVQWSRLYGGCIAVMMIEGQDWNTPLRLETVGPNMFKGLLVLDRWMVDPSLSDLVTDMGPDIGLPKFYTVVGDSPAMPRFTVHHSRIIRLAGEKLPYWQAISENLWGESVLERIYDRMIGFDSAATGTAQLVYKAYLRCVKIEGLKEIAAAGGFAEAGLIKQMDLMRRYQGIEGVTMLDAKDEFSDGAGARFTGLAEALSALGEQLAGALQIPLVRLFGQSPSGFNNGDNDLRMYYDNINQQQNTDLKVGVTKIYRLIAQSESVRLGEGFGIKFNPLWQLSEKEKAEAGGTMTTAIVSAHTEGLISDQVAMKELKQQGEPFGMFTNISDDDIDSADDVAAPPEPEMMEPTAEEPDVEAEPKAKKKVETEKKKKKPTADADYNGPDFAVLKSEDEVTTAVYSYLTKKLIGRYNPDKAKQVADNYERLKLAEYVAELRKKKPTSDGLVNRVPKIVADMRRLHDLEVVIENERGSLRQGGKERPWQVSMPADYGYIRMVPGEDGDNMDCHIGPQRGSDDVWVIRQQHADTQTFDEHKCMLGFDSMGEAMQAYLGAYTDNVGWGRIQGVQHMKMDDFKTWCATLKEAA